MKAGYSSRTLMTRVTTRLSIPLPARAAAEAAPVPTEAALAGSPILTVLNASIRMSQIGTADPPKKQHNGDGGAERNPDSESLDSRP